MAWLRKYLQIVNNAAVYERGLLKEYDFKVMKSISELYGQIKKLDDKHQLSRVIAGYSWGWVTQKYKSLHDKKDPVTGNQF